MSISGDRGVGVGIEDVDHVAEIAFYQVYHTTCENIKDLARICKFFSTSSQDIVINYKFSTRVELSY